MPKVSLLIVTALLLVLWTPTKAGAAAAEARDETMTTPTLGTIRADGSHLTLEIDHPDGRQVRILELYAFQQFNPSGSYPEAWSGAARESVRIERWLGKIDRLFFKFQLVDAATGVALGESRYATDLSGVPARDTPIPWPESVKGLTCPVGNDDLIQLGTKYVATNAPIQMVLPWNTPNPEAFWEVDGERIPIGMHWVTTWLDKQVKPLSDAGMNITLILILHVPTESPGNNPLIHPRTDLANTPMHHGAFNVTDARGLRWFRAAIEFLAERYTRPDRAYGRISGIIIGNELQAHWVWHNMGEAPAEDVIREYAVALRTAWFSVRKVHRDLRVYASMEHHWNSLGGLGDPLKEIEGPVILDGLAEWGRREGNFPWNLAFHPYPENLFEPRFWLDKRALHRYDTPKVTFKNLEVLTSYMNEPHLLYEGKPRRIILSEQGFHTPDGPDGEKIQAAAFACAYHKVRNMPEIDAFMMHRHVSARDEGGLKLGLWTWHPQSVSGFDPGRRKFIWDVFRKADTPQWREAFEFALPIIGIENWDEALPNYEIDKTQGGGVERADLIADLVRLRSKARVENSMDFRTDTLIRAAGWPVRTLFHHPPANGFGSATFTVEVPESADGRRPVLTLESALGADSADGVRFAVAVGDRELWRHDQVGREPTPASIDLSEWAGQTLELSFKVHCIGNASNDWGHWIAPKVVWAE